ncbi:MAG: 2-oxoacid:acceptor oxidoreductase family protein, partial [Oscillospiraceae bacterium]|nr:2-oxoacid:acceptor oxidoreductase family protein [Oscillospiraceae bacterium]
IITNTQQIEPMPVITGAVKYPENIVENIKAAGVDITAADALSLAVEAGTPKAVNVVLMGMVSKTAEFDEQVWLDALKQCVPPKVLDVNLKAFELGRGIA